MNLFKAGDRTINVDHVTLVEYNEHMKYYRVYFNNPEVNPINIRTNPLDQPIDLIEFVSKLTVQQLHELVYVLQGDEIK